MRHPVTVSMSTFISQSFIQAASSLDGWSLHSFPPNAIADASVYAMRRLYEDRFRAKMYSALLAKSCCLMPD